MSAPGPPDGLELYIANVVLSAVLVGPFVVFYWQGTWGIQDVYFFPSDAEKSAWLSFCVGFLGTYLICYSQNVWTKYLQGTNTFVFVLASRLYTAFGAFSIVAYWRGIWKILDFYTGTEFLSAILCVAIGLLVLSVTQTFCAAVTPPLNIFMDTNRTEYFKFGTWHHTKVGLTLMFAIDTFFTTVLTCFVVVTWRGIWTVLDLYLYPEDHMKSCLWCLAIYLIVMVFILLVQYPVCLLLCKLEASGKPLLVRLLLQDSFALPMAIGSITYWRGGWNLLLYFFMTNHKEIEVWLTHSVGTLGLIMCLAFTSIPCKGCVIDGEVVNGMAAYLQAPILQGYKSVSKNKRIEGSLYLDGINEKKEVVDTITRL